jgi:hypothetical protein
MNDINLIQRLLCVRSPRDSKSAACGLVAFAQPGEHFDSPGASPVANFRSIKVAHYSGKIEPKSKLQKSFDRAMQMTQ